MGNSESARLQEAAGSRMAVLRRKAAAAEAALRAAQAAGPAAATCGGVVRDVIPSPPDSRADVGLSMAGAYTCRRCEFVIVPGISSSMATMTRQVTRNEANSLDLVDKCPGNFTDELPGLRRAGGVYWEQTIYWPMRGEENTGARDGAKAAYDGFVKRLKDGDLYRAVGDECIQYEDAGTNMDAFDVWFQNQPTRTGTMDFVVPEADSIRDLWDGFQTQNRILRVKPTGYVLKKVPAGDPGILTSPPKSAKDRRDQEKLDAEIAEAKEDLRTTNAPPDKFGIEISKKYSSDTKLYVKPSIPFRVRFNNVTYPVNLLTLYYPSPFRIENVQHDAMLSLNDPSDPESKTIILIPIVGGTMIKAAGRFVSKIVTYMSSLTGGEVINEVTKKPSRVEIPTGNDWNITSLLPLKIVDDEPRVQAGYFTWDSAIVEAKPAEIQSDPCKRKFEWVPVAGGAIRKYIVIRKPIAVSHSDLYTIRRLPSTSPRDAIETIPEKMVYQPGPADNCPECDGGPGEVALPSFNVVPNNGLRNKNVVINILLGILSAVAIFIGIYFGVKWVTSDNGETFKWLGQKVGGFFGSFSAVGKSMGALAAPALVAMKKTSLPSFPMRRKSVSAAPAVPALPETPSLTDIFPTPTTTPEASIKEFGLGDTIPIAPTGNFMVSNPLASRARTPRANMGPTASRANAQKQKEAAGTGLLSLGAMEALEEARATGKTPPGWRIKKNEAGEITDIKPINLSGGHGGSTRRAHH